MGVTIRRNFAPLSAIRLLKREDWRQAGLLARELIIRHTTAGRDEDGQAFAPFSQAYREQRQRQRLAVVPTLQLSGQMLQSITVEPEDDRVTLRFVR